MLIGGMGAALLWVHQARVPETHANGYSRANAGIARSQDARYLRQAAEAGLEGAFLNDLAERRAGSRAQTIAHFVSDDFRRFNTELARIASSRGVELPLELDRDRRASYEGLSALNNEDFDRTWTSRALEMHGDAASALQSEAAGGSYPEAKRFAEQTLPLVQRRIVLIESVQAHFAPELPVTAGLQ